MSSTDALNSSLFEKYRILVDLIAHRYVKAYPWLRREDMIMYLQEELWAAILRYDGSNTGAAYLKKVLNMRARDMLRRPRQLDLKATEAIRHDFTGIIVDEFLAKLTARQKLVVQLRMNGCTFEEIRDITKLSLERIREALEKARKKWDTNI